MRENVKREDEALPPGWVWATIGEIAKSINPGFPSGQHNQEGKGVPHLRPMNISAKGEVDLSEVKYVEAADYDRLMQGDVLFNNTNSPALVGKTTHIRQDTNWAYSNHMTRLRLHKSQTDAGWVAHSLHYLFLEGFFRMNCRHHVNQASISSGFLAENVSIPLPPLEEQHRIVAKVEELFSDLDAGVAALKRVHANLKRYRASVLKAACEGRLVPTEAELARRDVGAGSPRPYEPAEVLLRRILAERRARWEAEHPGKKYVEPAAPQTDGLPELPEGWCWARIEQLAALVTKGSSPNWQGFDYQATGLTFVRSQNVGWGSLDLSAMVYLSPEFNQKERKSIIHEADVLLNIVGASIGRCAKATRTVAGGNLNQAVAIIRLVLPLVVPDFIVTYLLSPNAQHKISLEKVDVARANISLADINALAVPLPPLPEQRRIVLEIEQRLSVVVELEATVAANLARAGRLRQAVLKHAFEGRLVAQDPKDESVGNSPRRPQKEREREEADINRTRQPEQLQLF